MFHSVKRIIDWCKDFKKQLYIGFVFSFFSYWLAAAPVMLAAYTISQLMLAHQGKATFDPTWIWFSALFILVMIFLRFLFDYMRARYQETISYELVARDRLAIGDALKRVSLGYFQEMNTGSILSSITSGLTMLENMGIRIIDTFIGGYLNFLAIFLSLIVISPKIAMIALVAMVLSFLCLLRISKHSSEHAPKEAKTCRNLTSATLEYARGLPIVKSFGQDGASSKRMKKAIEESHKIHVDIENSFIPGNILHLLFLKIGSICIVLASCYGGYTNELSFPFMMLFIFLSFIIFASLEPISDSTHVLAVIDGAMDQLELLKEEHFIDENGKDIAIDHYDICFDHVSFGYDTRTIINDVSVNIPEHTSTAVIGPSGSGKTTLINLLARFYDVNKGKISVGGHDVREFTCDSLLSNISMVFQNVYLFHDTIRANICFGNADASEKDMIAAAKKARCHEFIMNLEHGYDTIVGEGGCTLSGGEKQRISIARAMLKNAPIIILDEATASIDPENEHLIQQAITELTKGKTIITIAHRLATIEHADQILVLEEGRIVQQGKHEDLMDQEGLYKRFMDARKKAEGWAIQ